MPRFDVIATQTRATTATYTGGGINYAIQANNGAHYQVFIDTNSDVVFIKSTDGGITWSAPTTVFTGTATALAVWYDRWSGRSTDKIRCAYTESVTDDILYRDIDTASSDALGTETTVFAGTDTAAGGALTITVGRDGRICVAGSIDAGAEDGAWSSTDDGATWGDTIADPSEGATQDQYLLLPDFNADSADIQLIFWDASANELSDKRYDDSGNTWNKTLIATGMTDTPAATHFRNFDAVVDVANSRVYVIAWSGDDLLNADLRFWTITNTTITEGTNVVQNSTDDQGMCALSLDTNTGYLYAFYGGKSDGSETWNTSVNIYYKVSTDYGTTWGSEIQLTRTAKQLDWMVTVPRFTGNFIVNYLGSGGLAMLSNIFYPYAPPNMNGGMT